MCDSLNIPKRKVLALATSPSCRGAKRACVRVCVCDGGHLRRGRVGGGDGGGPHAAAGEGGVLGVLCAGDGGTTRWCDVFSGAQVEGSGCAELEWRLRVWVDGSKAWGGGAWAGASGACGGVGGCGCECGWWEGGQVSGAGVGH